MESGLVTVVLPTYNRFEFTQRAISCVLAQTYDRLELIVVDDGSDPEQQIDPNQFLDNRLRQIKIKHGGVSAARNVALRESVGEYIALIDSDDLWKPDKLEKQVEVMRLNPQLMLCHTEEEWIRKGRRVNPRLVHKKARGEAFSSCVEMCRISPSAVLFRRDLLDEVGMFDESMSVCEDYDFWLRVCLRHQVFLIDQALVIKYGGHIDQLSNSVAAIDRFRVFSLIKLLAGRQLDAQQRGPVLDGIRSRVSILKNGAHKRSNTSLVRICENIEQSLILSTPNELQSLGRELINIDLESDCSALKPTAKSASPLLGKDGSLHNEERR